MGDDGDDDRDGMDEDYYPDLGLDNIGPTGFVEVPGSWPGATNLLAVII